MRRIAFAVIAVLVMASCALSYGGDGSKADPYVIYDISDYLALRSELNGGEEKFYKLSCDLQLTAYDELIAPIYTGAEIVIQYKLVLSGDELVRVPYASVSSIDVMGEPFRGHFDGQGHNIYVKIMPAPLDTGDMIYHMNSSLFGAIATVESDDPSADYAVKNLHVGGRILTYDRGETIVGGYLGAGITSVLHSGRIKNCTVSCDIELEPIEDAEALELDMIHAGGIVADMRGGEILSCDFGGNITTDGGSFYSYAGGIVGAMTYGKIQGCKVKHYSIITAMGEADSENEHSAGGIVGYLNVTDLAANSYDVTITGCTFEGGEISSDYSAGGIVGITYGGIFEDNTVAEDTRITGAVYAGGVAGILTAGALASENNVLGGIVQADANAAGGIIGLLELGYVQSNDSVASIQGNAAYKGGVIGQIDNHYGTSANVAGNKYSGAEYGIGIDENMQLNQNTGTTKQAATLSFLTASHLPSATEKESYSTDIQLSLPVIIDLSPIPTWLNPSQNSDTITLTCIPSTVGTFSFTLNAVYGEQTVSKTYTITVNSKLKIASTLDFPEYAEVGAFYDYTFTASAGGDDISSLTWSASGDIPGGLILNPITGKLSGNPTTEGTYTFEILANADNMTQASTGTLTVTVSKAVSIVAETTTSDDNVMYLPAAMIDEAYTYQLGIDQSGMTQQWYILAGDFPSGLTIDADTGLIYGTPNTAGTYYFIAAVNASSSSSTITATQEMSLTVLPELSITTSAVLPSARIGTPYYTTLSTNATYGTDISWDISGLPDGLTYNTSGLLCMITGTVSETGNFSITAQASYGTYSATKTFTLSAVRGFTILTEALPAGKTDYDYSYRLTTNALSTDAVTWSVIGGSLPLGLTLSSDTGRISGIPTVSGSFDFTVQAVTSSEYASRDLSIFISENLIITTQSLLNDAEISRDYSVQLMTNIGVSGNWTLQGGLLPEGLTLSTGGIIAGIPAEEGTFTFTVKAESGDLEAWGDFVLTVQPDFYIATGSLGSAVVGKAYSRQLMTNRNTSGAKWYVVGELPSGLSLSRDKGTLSGIPETGGSFDFTIQAVYGTYTAAKDFTLYVKPALLITTPSAIPPASRDYPYTPYTLLTDSASTVTWNFISGDMPSGIGFEDGIISGTPIEAGLFTFTVQAVADGLTAEKTFTLYVSDYLEILTSSPLPSAKENSPYSYTFTANTDVTGWYIIGGSIPAGLELGLSTGILAGTPISSDTYSFDIQAVNGRLTASKAFSLTVSPVMSVINPSVLPDARVNAKYTYQLRADANNTAWEISGGTLPSGLALNGDVITGTPTQAGEYSFTVRASSGGISAVKTLTLTVGTELQILTSTLKAAKVNTEYSHTFRTNKGDASWNIISGNLPGGITLDTSEGVISGASSEAGSFDFTLQAKTGVLTASRDFTLRVNPELNITTNSALPSARINTLYTYTLATDYDGAVEWNVIGWLPDGMNISGDTGELYGIPTEAGEFAFTVQATAGELQTEKEFTLTVIDDMTITTSALPNGRLNAEYLYALATDAITPSSVIWTISSGDLPTGLMLVRTTGKITGTPTAEGSYSFTVNAMLQTTAGRLTASRIFTINVYEEITALTIITESLPSGMKGAEYPQTVIQTDAPSSYGVSWDISGSLPAGLTFADGIISGTPSEAGYFEFSIQAMARTSSGRILTAYRNFALTVEDTFAITSTDLPAGRVGSNYSYTLATNSATPGSVRWFVRTGNLPSGLTLSGTTGKISGVPTAEGTSTFTVRAYIQTTSGRVSDDATFSITIHGQDYEISELNIVTSSLVSGMIGTEYSQTLETDAPLGTSISWDISGSLPAGLTFTSGTLSGTPTETGDFTFTLQAMIQTSAAKLTATRTYTLTIRAKFAVTTAQSDMISGQIGSPYSFTLSANSESSPAWSIIGGSLPAGLTLGRNTGTISGTPLVSGDFDFTVQAVSGSDIASRDFTLTIAGKITIVTGATLPSAVESGSYSETLMADIPSATWSVSAGKLPSGLTLSTSGTISGTPTESGAFSFTVMAVSGTLTARKDFSLTVSPALTIATTSLASGREGSPYSVTLEAEPYSSSATSWYKISGDLPAGIALNQSAGTISGTPTEYGTFTFRISAVRGNFSAQRDFTLTVESVLKITTPSPLPAATLGTAYSYTLMTNAGESDAVTWSAVSALPSGLSLDASTGTISGIPAQSGTFVFTARADTLSAYDAKDFSLTVNSSSSLTITTDSLPSGTLGTQYSYTLAAGNASGTLIWQLISGDIPAGLSLNRSTGTISGTPTLSGTFAFTVEVSSGGQYYRKSFTVTISSVLMITTESPLPSGKKGSAYSYTLTINTTASADWSIASGTLLAGLSLDVSTGTIYGTPTSAGDSVFILKAVSGGLTAQKSFTLTISPSMSITSSADLPAGKVSTPYVFTLATDAGQSSSLAWSVISGVLPTGLTLNTSTGIISGTPSAQGTYTFIIQAASGTVTAQKSFTLTINGVMNILTASPLADGKINTPYSCTFAADTPSAVWSIISGDLPSGLALSSGTLSGTPTTEGAYSFTVRAVYESASADKKFTLTIRPAMSIITPSPLPSAKTGQQYSCTLATDAYGLVPSWEIVSGDTLPAGLSLDKTAGIISGTPTTAGTRSFTVTATAGSITAVKEFMLTVEAAIMITSPQILPSAKSSGNYSFTLTASGVSSAKWYLIGGTLPEGLTLNSDTGIISGYTRAEGVYSFTVQAVSGSLTVTKDFTLTVGAEIVIATSSQLTAGGAGSSYSQSLSVDGGISAQWAVISGDVPPGLTLSESGILSGVPTVAGRYTFTAQAVSGYSSAVKTFTVDVALVITTGTLPNGTTGEPYSAVLQANGAAANLLTWSVSADRVITSGSQDVLPYGLTLAADGIISGTPGQAGTFSFTVYVSDNNGMRANRVIRITIDSPSAVPITTTSLPRGKVNQDYHAELLTTESGVKWTHTAGQMPPGLTLSESGLISGIPTQAGAFTFTVTASKYTRSGTRQLTLTVDAEDSAVLSPDKESSVGGSSGGGGCNSLGLSILLIGVMMFRKKR